MGGPIHWRMHLPVTPDRVFAVLDSDAGRASFWAETAVESTGHVEFCFINGERFRSRIIERRPPSLLVLDYPGGPVRFELAPDGSGGTDLFLTQEGIAPDEWNDVHAGWLNVLFPLKGFLTHGIDLRNHDSQRTWDAGYADQ